MALGAAGIRITGAITRAEPERPLIRRPENGRRWFSRLDWLGSRPAQIRRQPTPEFGVDLDRSIQGSCLTSAAIRGGSLR